MFQDTKNKIANLPADKARKALLDIWEILYSNGPDTEWDSETIEWVAGVMNDLANEGE